MFAFASVHGFPLQIPIWLHGLLLTRVCRFMGGFWFPPCHLLLPPQPINPKTGHHFPTVAASQSKVPLGEVTSPAPYFAQSAFPYVFSLGGRMDLGRGSNTSTWDGNCSFLGKTNTSEYSLMLWWTRKQKVSEAGKSGGHNGHTTAHVTPTSRSVKPL